MNNKYFKTVFICLGLMASIIITSWKQLSTGFKLITGDGYDGVIENVIVTHWYWVFKGERIWNEVGYFYPHIDTLGYNDAYFIFGLIAAFFRIFTENQFLAVELAHITIRAIGYLTFYRLSRYLGLTKISSILGAITFSIFYSITNTGHAQLILVGISPLFIYVTIKSFDNINQPKFYKYAALSSLLYGAIALTGFYITYFTTLFLITSLVMYICIRPNSIDKILSYQIIKKLFLWFILLLISITPFLIVYLPKLKETGGHPYTEIHKHLPKLQDVINIGDHSVLWGNSLNKLLLNFGVQLGSGELKLGFGFIFFFIFIIVSIWMAVSFIKNNKLMDLKWVVIVTATLFWIFCIVDFGGVSLWKYIYSYIPGGKGLRVVSRMYIFLSIPTTLIIFKFLDIFWESSKSIPLKILSYVLVFAMMVEQINTSPFVALETLEQNAFLNDLPNPPENCKSFYAKNPSGFKFSNPEIDSYYQVNVRAMLVSSHFNLPTIIGIASFAPPGWNFKFEPAGTFEQRILEYAHVHNLYKSLCVLDIKNRTWSKK